MYSTLLGILMLVIDVQLINAKLLIFVILFGIKMLESDEQSVKAELEISVNSFGITTSVMSLLPLK